MFAFPIFLIVISLISLSVSFFLSIYLGLYSCFYSAVYLLLHEAVSDPLLFLNNVELALSNIGVLELIRARWIHPLEKSSVISSIFLKFICGPEGNVPFYLAPAFPLGFFCFLSCDDFPLSYFFVMSLSPPFSFGNLMICLKFPRLRQSFVSLSLH